MSKTKLDLVAPSRATTVTIPVKVIDKARATLPTRPHDTDACWDLYTSKTTRVPSGGTVKVPTGIAFNIPKGYFGKVYNRSGVSTQRALIVKAGVIDSGYTGEIMLVVYNHGDMPEVIDEKTKLAQIAFHEVPSVELVQVEELESTDRADKGFGHSDKK